MKKTILITGSNGFTGRYVRHEFAKAGYQVIGLVNSKANANEEEIECNILDKEKLIKLMKGIKPTGIVHLAAMSFVAEQQSEAFYQVNLFGTLNLLEACEKSDCNPNKIIIASSANIYGDAKVDYINEDQPPSPMNHYAMSKLAMEYMVKLWFNRFNIIVTRPFNYTGIGQKKHFLVPKIVHHFKQGLQEIELGNLDILRDFSDVRDIARAYLLLYHTSIDSQVFNLCSSNLYTIKDILSIMEKISGYKINVKQNKQLKRDNEIKRLAGSLNKLHHLTGFSPKYTLEDTLLTMYQS